MSFDPEEIKVRANRAGISVAELCRRAGVARSTFLRWEAGSQPLIGNLDRVMEELARAEDSALESLEGLRASIEGRNRVPDGGTE